MLGSLSKHHISCQQHCSNASVRFLPSQQNSLITDHAASWRSSHILCTVFLRQLFRAWEKSETTALLQRQTLRVLFVTERLSSGQSLAGRELFFTFVASYAKQTKIKLSHLVFTDSKPSFSHETIFADTSLECGDALCMARNTGVLTEWGGGRKKCLHMPRSATYMEPDAPVFASRKLFKPKGVLGYFGCGREGRFVCACFKKGDGGLPQMSALEEPAQHNTPPHHSATD